MTTDAECLRTLSDVLTALKLNDFIIRVNHLNLLKGILTASGISQEKIPAALSCLKKVDAMIILCEMLFYVFAITHYSLRITPRTLLHQAFLVM